MALQTCLQCTDILRFSFTTSGELKHWSLEHPSTWTFDECEMCSFLFRCLPGAYREDENQMLNDCSLHVASLGGFKEIAGINATAFPFLALNKKNDCLLLGDIPFPTPKLFSAIFLIPFEEWVGITPTHPKVEIATLAAWIQESKASDTVLLHQDIFHKIEENSSPTGVSRVPNRQQLTVIDCTTHMLVSASPWEEYMTLSYRWGQSKNHEPDSASTTIKISDSQSAIPSKLPKTIEDSITVCTSLGFQYLWVDRYCISFDNPQELNEQIQRMNEIYQNSVLTIIACEGQDPSYGLPGISRLRVECPSICLQEKSGYLQLIPMVNDISMTPWSKRAWTYQEALLSTRRLYFTDRQVYFESPSGVRSELVPTLPGQFPPDFDSWIHARKAWAKAPSSIYSCLTSYSHRTMTFPGDTIKAMLGILAFYHQKFGVRHLWGMPFSANTPASRDESLSRDLVTFKQSLQWDMSRIDIPRREGFPSWSWAGWYGNKYWHRWNLESESHRGEDSATAGESSGDLDVLVELKSGQVLSWSEYQQQYDLFNKDPDKLSQIIHLDAYTSSIITILIDEKMSSVNPKVKVELETDTGVVFCLAGTDQAPLFNNGSCAYPISSFLVVHLTPSRYGRVDGDLNDLDIMLLVRDIGEHWERVALLMPHDSSDFPGRRKFPFEVKKEDIKMERRTIRLG